MSLTITTNIFDKFIFDNTEFVVINDKKSYSETLNNKLLIASVKIVDNKKVIVPIRDSELYNEVLEHYLLLKEIFSRGESNNGIIWNTTKRSRKIRNY